jgi:hypothetical protein
VANFKSRYAELGFYCCDTFRKFHHGEYVTDNKEEIAVLEKLADVERVDEPVVEEAPKKAPAKPKK